MVVEDVTDAIDVVFNRLDTLQSIIRTERRKILEAVGDSMMFYPLTAPDLSSQELDMESTRKFVDKFGGNNDLVEKEMSWAEMIWEWLQFVQTWSEEEFVEQATQNLEAWRKEKNEY